MRRDPEPETTMLTFLLLAEFALHLTAAVVVVSFAVYQGVALVRQLRK